jgi:hemerythrin-like domain-containing protein
MFGLFKKKNNNTVTITTAPATQYNTAPGTEIRYAPELVDSLKGDHQQLLSLYGEIQDAFGRQEYQAVSEQLEIFKSNLQSHLLTENVRLYIYLDRCLAHDASNSDLIRGFRREMDEIAKVAMKFLNKYSAIGVDEDLAAHFAGDFATIGRVLGERIQKEETVLYPLYLPSYS